MKHIIVVAENMRSTHNVGALLRTCEGLGVEKVYLCGITPYPKVPHDRRLPHIAQKLTTQIHKTALGAEETLPWEYQEDITIVLDTYRAKGWRIVGLEQTSHSVQLHNYISVERTVLVLGTEVTGIEQKTLALCDDAIEIPMQGSKESFNVVIAAGIALYALKQ